MELDLPLPDEIPPIRTFVPNATYSHVGDILKVYLEDAPAFAEQLTPEITILRAFGDKRIVGVKIVNVAEKVK